MTVPPIPENPLLMNPVRWHLHDPEVESAPDGPWVEARIFDAAVAAARSEGFAAGRAAASPDPTTDAHRPWPIAPDTVMPPRRQPVRWGSRADDVPTEFHDDQHVAKAYLAGLAAGRTEAAAAHATAREIETWLMSEGNRYLAIDEPMALRRGKYYAEIAGAVARRFGGTE